MMSRRTNVLAAALAVAAILVSAASPAFAVPHDAALSAAENHVPIAIDAAVMRPLGLLMTVGGAVLAVLPTAFVAITRPTDIAKPLDFFVASPFRYTFMDPLGEHPPKGMMD